MSNFNSRITLKLKSSGSRSSAYLRDEKMFIIAACIL